MATPLYWVVNPVHPDVHRFSKVTTCIHCKLHGTGGKKHNIQTIMLEEQQQEPCDDTRVKQ
jgi:hypothetical protein